MGSGFQLVVDARRHAGAVAKVGEPVLSTHRGAKVERSRPGSHHLVEVVRMPFDQDPLPTEAALLVVGVGRRQAVVATDLDECAVAHVAEKIHYQLFLPLGVRTARRARTGLAPPAWLEVGSARRRGTRFEQGRRRKLAKR